MSLPPFSKEKADKLTYIYRMGIAAIMNQLYLCINTDRFYKLVTEVRQKIIL